MGRCNWPGPGVWGLPRDLDAAVAVLREAVAAGVNHIDTSDFYGPTVTNQLIKQVLYPYPDGPVIVSKVGHRRGPEKSWHPALSPQELIQSVHDNLRNLSLNALDVVNLRVGGNAGPQESSIEEPLTVLAELQNRGLIRHLGVSNVTTNQLREAQKITNVVCVQNFYNVANRNDDEFIDLLAKQGIPYVPFFGGFTAIQSSVLDATAASLQAAPMQIALTWLLQHSPNILLIPGTSSVAHLRENLSAATMQLPPDVVAQLDGIAGGATTATQAAH
jgi:pyridoxine 4-dehydrogenase